MDPVETAAPPVIEEAIKEPAALPVKTPATEEMVSVSEEEVQQEAEAHKICRNCNYHDASGDDRPRCPACNFLYASKPVHQVPVKEQEPQKQAEVTEAQDQARADGLVGLGDKPAEDKLAEKDNTAEAADLVTTGDKPADAADKNQGDSEN